MLKSRCGECVAWVVDRGGYMGDHDGLKIMPTAGVIVSWLSHLYDDSHQPQIKVPGDSLSNVQYKSIRQHIRHVCSKFYDVV